MTKITRPKVAYHSLDHFLLEINIRVAQEKHFVKPSKINKQKSFKVAKDESGEGWRFNDEGWRLNDEGIKLSRGFDDKRTDGWTNIHLWM